MTLNELIDLVDKRGVTRDADLNVTIEVGSNTFTSNIHTANMISFGPDHILIDLSSRS